MLEFCDDDDPVIELPEVKELKMSGLLHLKEFILFQLHLLSTKSHQLTSRC